MDMRYFRIKDETWQVYSTISATNMAECVARWYNEMQDVMLPRVDALRELLQKRLPISKKLLTRQSRKSRICATNHWNIR